MKGTVVKSTGKWYNVRTNEGEIFACRIRGNFRLNGLPLTNPVAVGDSVTLKIEKGAEKVGTIIKIDARKNYLVRQSPRKKHFLHLMAANVDLAVLVTTLAEPDFKQGFLDRFLLLTEPYHIPTLIVVNKSDLFDKELEQKFEILKDEYKTIGYEMMACSTINEDNIDALREKLRDKRSVFAGQSGVGKSSLLNAIQPDLGLKVSEISNYSGKGQHTTTFACMFNLRFGGELIDTPGIKTLSFNNLTKLDVAHNFKEFFERSVDCKYSNCLHQNEPGCAVKEALDQGLINVNRYFSYLAILDEIDDQNRWEKVDY